ncbi:hypothetical protein TruAng_002806 [Truncatella angustata]|nr:hypothetical protein TruAng_002806 [Truncatella angustata]
MFQTLCENCARLGETGSPTEVPDGLAQCLTSQFSLEDLVHGIIQSDESGSIASLRALQAGLQSDQLNENYGGDSKSAAAIAEYVAKTYSNAHDPWSSSSSAAVAHSILDKQLPDKGKKIALITSTIISNFLRPLFSKSRPATVTASGRKAEFVETSRYAGSFNDPSEQDLKPWKHSYRYAISVFEWAVSKSDHDMLSKHWHQYTPVLLTLLDEPQTDIKVRALHIFSAFWERCPPGQMAAVGLADVFEQAIFPAVLYLPTLTPEDESIQILNAAYPALFQIAGMAYPEAEIAEPVKQPAFTHSQRKTIDNIIREGLLVGYRHTNEHIQLNECFCKKMVSIVNGIGILAVKHLKDIIPMASEIMTEPFGTKYPPALLAANQLLQATMRCCWPRIGGYHTEIIRTLANCYLNIEDEDTYPSGSPSQEDLKAALSQTSAILAAILKSGDTPLSEVVSPLIEKEPRLKPLFLPTKIH